MNDGARETSCARCKHNAVCKYKEEYLAAIDAVNKVEIRFNTGDPKTVRMQKVRNLEYIADISVTCR